MHLEQCLGYSKCKEIDGKKVKEREEEGQGRSTEESMPKQEWRRGVGEERREGGSKGEKTGEWERGVTPGMWKKTLTTLMQLRPTLHTQRFIDPIPTK